MLRIRMPKVDLPLDQRNIIITRSQEGILDIKKIFINKGANVFDLPAISIADPDDLNPLDEALNQINDFHWIIFSSSNGIKFVDKRLRYFNSSLKECSKKTKIAVVGEKTSKTLDDFGIKALIPKSSRVFEVFSPTTAIFVFLEHSFNELLKYLSLLSTNLIPLLLEKIIQ